MPRCLPALVVAAWLALDAAGSAQAPPADGTARWPALTLAPPNIERTDPSLARLRDRLIAAIQARRVDDVTALMAPTIRDQDVDTPVADVLDSFGPLEPGTPPGEEWLALEQGLRLGGIRRGSFYVVPYIERSAPQWKDRHERLFSAGRDVAIRGHADPSASIVSRVSYGLVQEAVGVANRAGEPGAACPEWTPVFDAERMMAWVCSTDTRQVSGLYYAFSRVASGWKLTRIYSLPD